MASVESSQSSYSKVGTLIPKENIKTEIESQDYEECVVCVSQSAESYDIFTTKTTASFTPLHVFLSKFTNTELPICQNIEKYICKSCLKLVNDMEKAEIEFMKLKRQFDLIISKNSLFHLPHSVQIECVKNEPRDSDDGSGDELRLVRDEDPIPDNGPQCSQTLFKGSKSDNNDVEFSNACETILEVDSTADDDRKPTRARRAKAVRKSYAEGSPQKSETKTKTGEKQHECEICKRRFKYNSLLLIHARTHTGEKPYECALCQKKFGRKVHLQNHLLVHSRKGLKPDTPFECSVCQRQYKRKQHLQEHLRVHSGEKPFECNVCSYTAFRKHDIVNHYRTHTGEKPHECSFCQRRFAFKGNLREHVRTHTGEKPYVCNLCPRSFSYLHVLKSHKRTHTDEKPFECDICSQQFKQKSHLKCHLTIHTGEKPFECTYCSRRFSRKRALEEHVRTHTGEKPFECQICLHRFAQSSNLLKHLRNHKKNETLTGSTVSTVPAETNLSLPNTPHFSNLI